MLSRIGIILVVLYFALFAGAFQVVAIEYPLPYPGMLPNNPAYFFKVARDDVTSWFIFDPVTKAFYQLFLADKRLATGKSLMDTGDTKLGETTFNIAEDYYVNA